MARKRQDPDRPPAAILELEKWASELEFFGDRLNEDLEKTQDPDDLASVNARREAIKVRAQARDRCQLVGNALTVVRNSLSKLSGPLNEMAIIRRGLEGIEAELGRSNLKPRERSDLEGAHLFLRDGWQRGEYAPAAGPGPIASRWFPGIQPSRFRCLRNLRALVARETYKVLSSLNRLHSYRDGAVQCKATKQAYNLSLGIAELRGVESDLGKVLREGGEYEWAKKAGRLHGDSLERYRALCQSHDRLVAHRDSLLEKVRKSSVGESLYPTELDTSGQLEIELEAKSA